MVEYLDTGYASGPFYFDCGIYTRHLQSNWAILDKIGKNAPENVNIKQNDYTYN